MLLCGKCALSIRLDLERDRTHGSLCVCVWGCGEEECDSSLRGVRESFLAEVSQAGEQPVQRPGGVKKVELLRKCK